VILDDLEEVALLWREATTAEEEREFRALAEKVLRRARLVQHAELALAMLLAAAAVVAATMAPAPATIAIGAVGVAALAGYSWKRHRLSQAALLVGTGDRASFIDLQHVRARARLRHSRLGLWLFFPAILGGSLFTYSVRQGGDVSGFAGEMLGNLGSMRGVIALAVALGYFAHLVRHNLHLRAEACRLGRLDRDYREEAAFHTAALARACRQPAAENGLEKIYEGCDIRNHDR
jgi:hypothetical protein